MKKSDGRNTDISRLFIYYNSRAKNNKSRYLSDSGCSMTSAIEALEEFGTCLEVIWPYNISKVNARPSDRAFQEAKNHTITEALQIRIDLNEMKSCLAQGFPFAFGLRLFRSFDGARRSGAVPIPDKSDRIRSSHGRLLRVLLHNEDRLLFLFLLLVMHFWQLATAIILDRSLFVIHGEQIGWETDSCFSFQCLYFYRETGDIAIFHMSIWPILISALMLGLFES